MKELSSHMLHTLSLRVLAVHVQIQCADADSYALLAANYGGMQEARGRVVLRYRVSRIPHSEGFRITHGGQLPRVAADARDLLWLLEQDLIIALQWRRRDLYFVHAAALAQGDQALLLVAPSGQGKSTFTWALLHHGFHYLSDELSPVDLSTRAVYPYPHALCLKGEPPGPYPLPAQTLFTSSALYIPTPALPNTVDTNPRSLAAIFFLTYRAGALRPILRPLSLAEASARLLSQALNPLAHRHNGLEGAMALAASSACFLLQTAALPATCAVLTTTWQELGHAQ